MQAPSPFALASHFTLVCFAVSKCLFSISWCIFNLMLLNDELCSSLQSNLLFLDSGFFFNSGRSGSESLASFGIILVRWCTLPRNDRNCFSVLGLSSFVMASVFVMSGVVPLGVIVKPSHSMMFFFANSHFCKFIASPSLSSLLKIFSYSFFCSRMDPLVITRKSSRNANFEEIPSNILSIVFWNVAGMSVRP